MLRCLVEVKLELEWRTALMELMERIAVTETVCVRFRIERIAAQIELSPFLRIGEHLLGGGHIDELLLGELLLIAMVRVRMPFLGGPPVCLDDLLLGGRSFHVENLVVVATFGLFLQFTRLLDALFGALQVLVQFGGALEVTNCYAENTSKRLITCTSVLCTTLTMIGTRFDFEAVSF